MIAQLYPLTAFQTAAQRERGIFIYAMSTVSLLSIPGIVILDAVSPDESLFEGPQAVFGLITLMALIVLAVSILMLNRRGSPLASTLTIVLLGTQSLVSQSIGFSASIGIYSLLIIASGLLLGHRAVLGAFVFSSAVMAIYGLIQETVFPVHLPTNFGDQLQHVPVVGAVALVSWFFLRVQRGTGRDLELNEARSRLRLAQITTELSGRITQQAPTAQVLNNAVSLIVDSYPSIYHAQVFLIENDTQVARLTASTGEAGRELLARRHGLPVASQSVIGQVTGAGVPVVTRAGEAVHRPNPLLPETAAEAAFPLKLGDTIIGALDLQSRYADAFADEDLPIFQALADTIAVVVDNDRLSEETQRRLLENQRLLEEARASAREVQRLNRQLTRDGWNRLLSENRSHFAVGLDLRTGVTQREADTPTIHQAARANHTVTEVRDGAQVIAVPLRVRGEVIGAMEFEIDGYAPGPNDQALLETVGERLGAALDTLRLYEETERLAQREARLNALGQRMSTANHVDSLLAETARGLQDSLGAGRVAIRLGTPAADNGGPR
jgi:GAF domain-containing protein